MRCDIPVEGRPEPGGSQLAGTEGCPVTVASTGPFGPVRGGRESPGLPARPTETLR